MKKNYLTTECFETFLQDAYFNGSEGANDSRALDLSGWEFFDPYSLIFLLLMSRYQPADKPRKALHFGAVNPALPYLGHVGFVEQLKRMATASDVSRNIAPSASREILLKITPIEQRQDITEALKHLIDSTATILRDHLSYTPQDSSLFLGAFAEVAQNILDHSGDRGFAAAQVYTTKKGKRFAAIAVGDLGVGIRTSLAQRYPKILTNDVIAIRKAFDPAASRFDNRGWGLTQVRSITEKYNGTLWVRSGRGLVKFHRLFSSFQTNFFPGTQISIYLESRNSKKSY